MIEMHFKIFTQNLQETFNSQILNSINLNNPC